MILLGLGLGLAVGYWLGAAVYYALHLRRARWLALGWPVFQLLARDQWRWATNPDIRLQLQERSRRNEVEAGLRPDGPDKFALGQEIRRRAMWSQADFDNDVRYGVVHGAGDDGSDVELGPPWE